MRQRLGVFELDGPVGKQAKGPCRAALRRLAAGERDDVRLEVAVDLASIRPLGGGALVQGLLETFLDEPLLHAVDLALAYAKNAGDFRAGLRRVLELARITVE